VLGSTPLTFVTPTPFTVILDKFISISNELLVPIRIVAKLEGDELGLGVMLGVIVGVILIVGVSESEGGGVTLIVGVILIVGVTLIVGVILGV
jgi:hypothetical protein